MIQNSGRSGVFHGSRHPVLLAGMFLVGMILAGTMMSCTTAPPGRDEFPAERITAPVSRVEELPRQYGHHRRYYVSASPQELWNLYRSIDQRTLWSGPVAFFRGMADSVRDDFFTAADPVVPPVEECQSYLVHLRFLRVVRMNAAFRITSVSDAYRTLEFTYLEDNTSWGRQRIVITPTPPGEGYEGGSTVDHHTQYASGRVIRDRLLYPPFHSRAIDEFHRAAAARLDAAIVVYRGRSTR